jgi:hypothetical protein
MTAKQALEAAKAFARGERDEPDGMGPSLRSARDGCSKLRKGGELMWTLVVVFVVSGGSFTVPGFSTAEKCKAAQLQTIDELNSAFAKFGLKGRPLYTSCRRVD